MMAGGGMEMFATLMMLGVRVREVVDLEEGSVWVPAKRLLLIDQGLTKDERERVTDRWLVTACLEDQTPPIR